MHVQKRLKYHIFTIAVPISRGPHQFDRGISGAIRHSSVCFFFQLNLCLTFNLIVMVDCDYVIEQRRPTLLL